MLFCFGKLGIYYINKIDIYLLMIEIYKIQCDYYLLNQILEIIYIYRKQILVYSIVMNYEYIYQRERN